MIADLKGDKRPIGHAAVCVPRGEKSFESIDIVDSRRQAGYEGVDRLERDMRCDWRMISVELS